MIEKGYSLHFEGNSCTIYMKKEKNNNKSLLIARVKMKENMCFPIQWRYKIDTAIYKGTSGQVMVMAHKV